MMGPCRKGCDQSVKGVIPLVTQVPWLHGQFQPGGSLSLQLLDERCQNMTLLGSLVALAVKVPHGQGCSGVDLDDLASAT